MISCLCSAKLKNAALPHRIRWPFSAAGTGERTENGEKFRRGVRRDVSLRGAERGTGLCRVQSHCGSVPQYGLAGDIIKRILDAVHTLAVGEASVGIGISIGIAGNADGGDARRVLEKTDQAMYRAKRAVGNRIRLD